MQLDMPKSPATDMRQIMIFSCLHPKPKYRPRYGVFTYRSWLPATDPALFGEEPVGASRFPVVCEQHGLRY